MRGGVGLPERAEVADLPAADGLGGLFVTGVWGEVAGDGPAADAGAVGLEIETAEQFAGDGTAGRARRGTEQPGGQSQGLRGPVWMMVAPRTPRLPGVGLLLRTGAKIIGAKLVKTSEPRTELGGQSAGTKPARPPPGNTFLLFRSRCSFCTSAILASATEKCAVLRLFQISLPFRNSRA